LEQIGLTLERRAYKFHQVVPPEWLGEKTNCALSHRPVAIRLGTLRADEYNGHAIVGPGQFIL